MTYLKALEGECIQIGGIDVGESVGFDGVKFLNTVILIIFLLLLVFGSTKIGKLEEVIDFV